MHTFKYGLALSSYFLTMLLALAAVQTLDGQDLSMSIVADQDNVIPCEPLSVSVILENQSNAEIHLLPANSSTIRIECSYGGESFSKCQFPAAVIDTFQWDILKARESKTVRLDVFVDGSRKCLFKRLGKYKVRATYYQAQHSGEKDSSVAVTASTHVVVVAPGKEDVAAAELFVEPLIEDMYFRNAIGDSESVNVLSSIVENYPSSRFADYSRFMLGQYYLVMYQSSGAAPDSKNSSSYAQASWDYFYSVSDSLRVLKLEAVMGQATIVNVCPELRRASTAKILLHELERLRSVAEKAGLAGEVDSRMRELRLLAP